MNDGIRGRGDVFGRTDMLQWSNLMAKSNDSSENLAMHQISRQTAGARAYANDCAVVSISAGVLPW